MRTTNEMDQPLPKRKFVGKLLAGAVLFVLLMLCILAGQIFEHVDAGESVVVQYPNGSLFVAQQPGYVSQWFGTIEHFRRSSQSEFVGGESIKTRFNDGAHGYISGSIRYDLPDSPEEILDLYRTYRTQTAIDKQLVGQNIMKAVYMTGPLMSSKESYSNRRNEMISHIENQATHGVFQTQQTTIEVEDPITQKKKWVDAVEVKRGKNDKGEDGKGDILRQEESPLQRFKIHLYNLTISEIKYDDVVEKQIAAQQQAIMQVQTAIAQSKEAEQQTKTAEEKGKATAMSAKWEQEAIKAKAIVVAEQEKAVLVTNAQRDKDVAVTGGNQRKEVAELDRLASVAYKEQQINIGQGEAERKKLAMAANGALEQKLDAYKYGKKVDADALAAYKGNIVPVMMMAGGTPAGGSNALNTFLELQAAESAKRLGLDLTFDTGKKP